MKIALVDTLFSWPPHGGAEVDLYYVANALQQAGYDVRLFASQVTPARERRGFDPATPSIPRHAPRVPRGRVRRTGPHHPVP